MHFSLPTNMLNGLVSECVVQWYCDKIVVIAPIFGSKPFGSVDGINTNAALFIQFKGRQAGGKVVYPFGDFLVGKEFIRSYAILRLYACSQEGRISYAIILLIHADLP